MTNRDKVNEMARYCAVHDCRACGIREECHNAGIRWKPELTWNGLLKEYPDSFGLVYSALCKITGEKPADSKSTGRADILHAAEKCVCGDREADYGNPEGSFKAIARLWTAHIKNRYPNCSITIDALDVAMMMANLKQARIETGKAKRDSFVDAAGYIACAGEISLMEV